MDGGSEKNEWWTHLQQQKRTTPLNVGGTISRDVICASWKRRV